MPGEKLPDITRKEYTDPSDNRTVVEYHIGLFLNHPEQVRAATPHHDVEPLRKTLSSAVRFELYPRANRHPSFVTFVSEPVDKTYVIGSGLYLPGESQREVNFQYDGWWQMFPGQDTKDKKGLQMTRLSYAPSAIAGIRTLVFNPFNHEGGAPTGALRKYTIALALNGSYMEVIADTKEESEGENIQINYITPRDRVRFNHSIARIDSTPQAWLITDLHGQSQPISS